MPIKHAAEFRRWAMALALVLFMAIGVVTAFVPRADDSPAEHVVVYQSPECGCCGKWVDHPRRNGFSVDERFIEDMGAIMAQHGVPADLASCHTALVAGYVVEGQVPASDIRRLLQQRPRGRRAGAPVSYGFAPCRADHASASSGTSTPS